MEHHEVGTLVYRPRVVGATLALPLKEVDTLEHPLKAEVTLANVHKGVGTLEPHHHSNKAMVGGHRPIRDMEAVSRDLAGWIRR